jgi:hypothetical protein
MATYLTRGSITIPGLKNDFALRPFSGGLYAAIYNFRSCPKAALRAILSESTHEGCCGSGLCVVACCTVQSGCRFRLAIYLKHIHPLRLYLHGTKRWRQPFNYPMVDIICLRISIHTKFNQPEGVRGSLGENLVTSGVTGKRSSN